MFQHVLTNGAVQFLPGTGAVSGTASQGLSVTDSGEVECVEDGTITHTLNGLPFDTNGRLVITSNAVDHTMNGIPYDSAGAVCVSGAVSDSNSGSMPFASGKLVMRGVELVTNGSFDSGTGWLLGDSWSITGGNATCDGSQVGDDAFAQTGVVEASKNYTIEFDLVVRAGALTSVTCGGATAASNISTSGRKTYSITTTSTANLAVTANSTFEGDVDNLSVRLAL